MAQLDVVFFSKLVSDDGAIHHSGDEREGDEKGDDESINVTTPSEAPSACFA